MNKDSIYSYKHFFKYNNYPYYFIFNNEDDYDFSFDDEEENEDFNLDELNFKLEQYETKIDEFVEKTFTYNENLEYSKLELYENKINFVKEKLSSNYQKIPSDNPIWDDLNCFGQVLLSNTMVVNYYNDMIVYLVNYFKKEKGYKNEEILTIPNNNSREVKKETTKKAIESKKYKLIINPCFQYKNIISNPLFLDLKNNCIGEISYSTKTTKEVKLKACFNKNVIVNSIKDFKVENYLICLLKHNDIAFYKKGINEYVFNDWFSNTKTKPKNISEKSSLKIMEFIDEYEQQFKNFVDLVNDDEKINVINKKGFERPSEDNPEIMKLNFADKYKILNQVVNKFNPELKLAGMRFIKEYYEINKNKNHSEIIKFFLNEKLIHVNEKFETSNNLDKQNTFKRFFDKNKNKYFVWMDFEGVTSTFPIIDYHRPWTQLISQVSIVKTTWNDKKDNYEEFYSNDYVYDPLNYSHKTLIEIINDIYDEKAEAYVVYNKSYEEKRIEEIKKYLELYFMKAGNDKYSHEYQKQIFDKIDNIISNILDIAFFTKLTKIEDFKLPLITIGFTKGKYSIKLFEKFITKYNIQLENRIIPYSNLDIKNGAMALDVANSRAVNRIGDVEWDKKVKELKLYCHNDVIAMIMLGEFIWKCWKNKKEINDNFDRFMLGK